MASTASPLRIKKKVVFLGESGVGKTSIVLRYDGKGFDTSLQATLGSSYLISAIPIATTTIELQIWDTAGQERFRSMVPMYLRKTDIAILVFDITDKKSFDNLDSWVDYIWNAETNKPVRLVILGNKTDLEHRRAVEWETANEYAGKIGAAYHETSAASNTGIEEAFFTLASQIAVSHSIREEIREDREVLNQSNIILAGSKNKDKEKEKEKTGCCT